MAGQIAGLVGFLAAGVGGQDRQVTDAVRRHDGGRGHHAGHPQFAAGTKLMLEPSIMISNVAPAENPPAPRKVRKAMCRPWPRLQLAAAGASPGVWTGFSPNHMAGHFARSCDALAADVAAMTVR